MTRQLERSAIEAYLTTEWAAATPIGYDGHNFTATADSIALTIQSGTVLQGSIGKASNRLICVGLLQVRIFTDPGKGSAGWRGYAETLEQALRNTRLTSAGATGVTPSTEFVRFSPAEQHPYIAGTSTDAGLMTTTLNAPFWRFDTE